MILGKQAVDKEEIRERILQAGALAAGFAEARDIDAEELRRHEQWIGEGRHAGMDYLARHLSLKGNPSSVVENAATVISVAFSYAPSAVRDDSLPAIACYALGEDYHDVIRRRLTPVTEHFKVEYGGEWRICIDSAPLPERYWAKKCGIGMQGKNGSVIVESAGSYVFLAEIVTTVRIAPDEPSRGICSQCGECSRACPQNALSEDGTIDSRRCLNYLTIEHRGPWEAEMAEAMLTEAARHTLFGCDICQKVCPHNKTVVPTDIGEFQPKPQIMNLTAEEVLAMTQPGFSAMMKGSPLKRAKLEGLRRNAANTLPPTPPHKLPE